MVIESLLLLLITFTHLIYKIISIASRGILCNSAITLKSDEHSNIPLAVGCAPELDVVVLPAV